MYRKSEDVIARQIAGETLLVPIRGDLAGTQSIFALDGVGEFIWQLLDEKVEFGDILDRVLSDFEVERDQAEADIQGFVDELLAADLILLAG